MPPTIVKNCLREIFRWYLRRFPLRDGKANLYERCHSRLLPPERFRVAGLDPGFRMRLDLADPEQRKVYFFSHYHERYEAALIRTVLEPGEVFWDIGANIGYFSLVAAQAVRPDGRVVAFEPGQAAYQRLLDNLTLNAAAAITAYQVAVGQEEGEAVLYVAGDLADSAANLYAPRAGQTREEVCRVVALDQFGRDKPWSRPQLIKIDAEGAELAVLQGARQTLAQTRPLLLLELESANLKAAGQDKEAVAEFLRPLGYAPAYLHKGRWHRTPEVRQARGRNIFWFQPDLPGHREKVRRLPGLGEAIGNRQ